MMYAALYTNGGKGACYEVEPVGEVEPDPDCTVPGMSYQVPSARVVRRVKMMSCHRRRIFRVFGVDERVARDRGML